MKNNSTYHSQAHGVSRIRRGHSFNSPLLSSLRLLTAFLLCSLYLPSFATDGNFGGGDGSSTNPYLIEDARDLTAFRDSVNAGKTSICGKLTADIDLSTVCSESSGTSWASISFFSGTFDGNGFSITNLYIYNTIGSAKVGFIKQNYGTIKNLHIQGSVISTAAVAPYCGGIAAENKGYVQCCSFSGTVNGSSTYLGGIVGFLTGGSITNCWSDATVTNIAGGSGAYAGGIAGMMAIRTDRQITNCLFTGNASGGGRANAISVNGSGYFHAAEECYYLNGSDNNRYTEQISAAQMKSGEVAWLLQGSQSEQVWGQVLGSGTVPALSSDIANKVCRLTYTNGSTTVQTAYTNYGKTLGMPKPDLLKQVYGAAYDSTLYYSWSADSLVNQPVKQDLTLTPSPAEYCAISSPETFANFAASVNAGNVYTTGKVTNNIDFATWSASNAWTMITNFAGTLDGQGYTISNFNKDRGLWDQQPFFSSIAAGGTVKNLTFSLCSASVLGNSALIAQTNNGTIQGITIFGAWIQGRDNNTAGIASNNGGTIADCAVLKTTLKKRWSGVNNKTAGGVCGYNNNAGIIKNCLSLNNNYVEVYPGDASIGSSSMVVHNSGTVTNCFADKALHKDSLTATATIVTAAQLQSGAVARALQAGRTDAVWGQTLNTDDTPMLTGNDSAQVYLVQFLKNNVAFDTLFVNRYNKFNLPTIQELAGDGYDAEYIYNVSYNTTDGDNEEVAVTADTQVLADMKVNCVLNVGINLNGDGTTENPCLLSTAEDFVKFRNFVNNVRGDVSAKLTKDIDLVSVYGEGTGSWKAIENYNGTFDGAHHTINIGKHEYQDYPGLFGVINSNSKITNLHVEGFITDSISSNDYNGLGGIANMMVGGLVSNCSFSGKLNCAGLGGGIVGNVTKGGKITDCWSDADVYAGEVSGGIAGSFDYLSESNKDNIISNCLFLGTDTSDWMYDPIIYSFNDDDRSDGTVDNCYFINSDFSASGELVTVAQLKSGYVLGKLGSAWAQTLGEDTIPTPCKESKKGSANYIYHGADGWACDDFRITDGTALPVGLEFLAKKLTNSRTFSEGYYTVCLPYDLPVPVNTTYSDFSNVDDAHTTVNFTTGSGNMLSAYQPYMIKVTDRSVNLGGENISVKAQPASTSSTVFVGTVTGLTNEEAANAGAYILQSDNYWHPVKTENTNATIPAYRAYLVLPSASAAKSYRFVVDGVSTGISSVNAGSSISSGAVYDLQGRKIADNYEDVKNSLATGIYVVNGKKIVKK